MNWYYFGAYSIEAVAHAMSLKKDTTITLIISLSTLIFVSIFASPIISRIMDK